MHHYTGWVGIAFLVMLGFNDMIGNKHIGKVMAALWFALAIALVADYHETWAVITAAVMIALYFWIQHVLSKPDKPT